jgi:hypothetical protein
MTLIVNQYSTSQDFSVPDSDERQSNVTDCVIAGLKLVFLQRDPVTSDRSWVNKIRSPPGKNKKALLNPAGLFKIKLRKYNLNLYNIGCCRAFSAIYNVKLDPGAFFQRPEAVCLNGRVMDKYILAAILLDKTKSFCIIKPFYCTF